MKKIYRKIAQAASACLLCAGIAVSGQPPMQPVHTYADTVADYEQKIKDLDNRINEIDQQIATAGQDIEASKSQQDNYWNLLVATQEKIDTVNLSVAAKEEEIKSKQAEIDNKQLEIDNKALEITETERKIADTEAQIEMLEKQNEENLHRFAQIVRANYINDSGDYLSVISGATDFYDIFVRSKLMDSVTRQNEEFMKQLQSDIHRLEDKKVQLGDDIKALEDQKEGLNYDKMTLQMQKEDLEDEKIDLDERVKYFNDLNSSYWGEYNTYASQIQDLETRQANLQYEKKVTQADREKAQAAMDEEIRRAQERAKNNTVYDTGEWAWPLDRSYHLITTTFGWDAWRNGNHGGIDIGNSGLMGANIYASKGGEVIVAKTTYIPGYDYGMYVVIDHGSGYQTLYAHCSAIYVSVGQTVNKGDCIAAVGATGWATGPHLHFEVRKDSVRIDPLGVVALPQ